jgi:hypothetical protein
LVTLPGQQKEQLSHPLSRIAGPKERLQTFGLIHISNICNKLGLVEALQQACDAMQSQPLLHNADQVVDGARFIAVRIQTAYEFKAIVPIDVFDIDFLAVSRNRCNVARYFSYVFGSCCGGLTSFR